MADLVAPQARTVAIVIPAYDEESCISELVQRLTKVFESEPDIMFSVFLIDNGSEDETWNLIMSAASRDPRFKGIQLSRNFDTDGGLTAGLEFVTQDAVILMCADLQDPPELIPEFLRLWQEGFDNVYGVITNRAGTSLVRRINSEMFYRIAGSLSDVHLPPNASDFRLLSRAAYEPLRKMNERGRYLRGMAAWSGFPSIGVPMDRPERFAGISKATTQLALRVATRGILSNSTKPLRLITIIGVTLSTISFISTVLLAALWILRGVPFAGFGTLVSVSLLAFGVLSLMLGIISEYVGMIYNEVKQRPNYVIRSTYGIE